MRYEGTEPHEKVIIDGPIGHLKGELFHYNYRDFAHQIETVQTYSDLAARAMFAENRKAGFVNLALRPVFRFLKCYLFKLGFLDGWPGFIIAITSAFYVHAKYTKLYELKRIRIPGDTQPLITGQGRSEHIDTPGA